MITLGGWNAANGKAAAEHILNNPASGNFMLCCMTSATDLLP